MKLIFKNFIHVIRRFKTSSLLNILSLSAAFTVFIVIIMQLYYDFGYNRNFEKIDSIYQLASYSPSNGANMSGGNAELASKIASRTPLVENYTTLRRMSISVYAMGRDENTTAKIPMMTVSSGYADMFEPVVIEGDFRNAISEQGKAAISESIAKEIFGNESPIGKTLVHYYDSKETYTITAIVKDFPENSSFNNCIFTQLVEHNVNELSYLNYVEIKKENEQKLNDFLSNADYLTLETIEQAKNNSTSQQIYFAKPLASTHFHHLEYIKRNTQDYDTAMALLGIALLCIAIAYINFVNFSMAMAPARLKTLNLQHILGANKISQRIVIASESAFFTIIALAIAMLCVYFIKNSSISEFFTASLALGDNINIIILTSLISILASLILGFYPAHYITTFDVQDALKGTSGGNKGAKTRNILITIQYTAAIALVTIAIFIKMQHNYMLNYSWGLQKENIAYISMSKSGTNVKTLGDELIKDANIVDYTTSQYVPSNVGMSWDNVFRNKKVYLRVWPVGDNFLHFFGVPVMDGKDFTEINNPEKLKLIFNEEFIRKYDLTSDIIGETFPCFDKAGDIVGIAKDINFESLKDPISPMAFVTLGVERDKYIFVKLSDNDIKRTVEYIETVWKKQSKEPFEIRFLDEKLDSLYRQENNLAKLVGLFSIITILIAIMGVYGLIIFNTKYRAKEIAIRKINGATENTVVYLINKSVLIQFTIGFVLAVPISYYFINQWLSQFAYRIELYWWVFPLSAIIVLMITIITVSWQSWKAATVNPVKLLKTE